MSPDRNIQQDPHAPGFYRDPSSRYRDWHRIAGPIWWQDFDFWCLKGFDEVDAALRDRRLKRLEPAPPITSADIPAHAACISPSWPAHLGAFTRTERFSLLALEGSAHARLRRRVATAFTSRRIESLESIIRSIAHDAVDRVAEHDTVDLLSFWAAPIPVIVIARLLGVPEDECDQLLEWSHAMVRVYTLTQTRAEEDAAEDAAAAFEKRILSLVTERRQSPRDDLISELCSLRGEDHLGDAEIVSSVILLLNAGHEATVHQLGNAVHTLLEQTHTEIPRWFGSNKQLDATVQELGRYRTPLHLFIRYAQEDIALGSDVTLKRGERLGLLLGAANHDPIRFTEPARFNPDRDDGATIGFGAGVHYCLGVQLARLEIGIALQVLFERLPQLALAEIPVVADTWHFHGLERLLVRPHG